MYFGAVRAVHSAVFRDTLWCSCCMPVFLRGFIDAEETNRLKSILNKTVAVICILISSHWMNY